jgi:hypothetical protein
MLGQLRQPPCTINEIEKLIVDEQIALGCLMAAVERALVEHEDAAETIAALKAREGRLAALYRQRRRLLTEALEHPADDLTPGHSVCIFS